MWPHACIMCAVLRSNPAKVRPLEVHCAQLPATKVAPRTSLTACTGQAEGVAGRSRAQACSSQQPWPVGSGTKGVLRGGASNVRRARATRSTGHTP